MKKIKLLNFRNFGINQKLLRTMKLSFLFLFACFLQVSATVYSQNTKFTFDVKNKRVLDILRDIEDQSEFRFFYQREQVNVERKIDLDITDQTVENILAGIFSNENVEFQVRHDNLILLKPAGMTFGTLEFLAKNGQQQRTVAGKVTDTNNQPLPGVTVVVKGTTQGTVTSADGDYSITNIPEDATLVFSFVGMSTQEIDVSGQQTINIVMREETLGLDEVIVIGYGTARRKDFTGSVSSLNIENSAVALLPNTNALESLKGNISGLNIGATNSAGGQPSMIIRGQNSITGSNDPLIVLDGVIFLGSLNDINPNDIANVDILKDAVSSAVYGSRSANGVIAITTKRGRSEKPLITFNISSGIQTWQDKPVMMKGEQWIEVVNARNQYTQGSTTWMKTGELDNLAAGKERVWLDEVTQTGVIEDYQLAVSGAAKGVNYYLSTTYNKNKGVVMGDEFDRISVLGKINTDITSWLKIGVDAAYSRRDYSGFAANIGTAQVMSPYGVMYRDDDKNLEKYPYTQSGINPLWGVNDNTRDNQDILQSLRLNSNMEVTVPWVKGLSYRINFLTNLDQRRLGQFYYEDYYIAEGEGLHRYQPSVVVNYLTNANGYLQNDRTFSYVFDNILAYKNAFGDHSVDVTMVATRDYQKYNMMNTSGSDYSANGSTTLGMWGLHKATVQKVNLNANERANIGYLGRLNYSYLEKYFLTGSFRRDGASVFGADNKWANFAAAGVAWRISNEKFMDGFASLNDLKLKVSWGQNGNQGIGPYSTLSQVANGASGGYRYQFSDNPGYIYYGLVQSTLGNYDLGWESTESWNTGFESAWLNNRLFVDLDLYFSKTTDQIFTRNIPVMTGFKTITTSMGQVDNKGVELTLRSINVQNNNFEWTSQVTFWKNRNKLVKLYGEDIDGDGVEDDDIANSLFIGKSLGAIFGYKQIGIVQEDDTEYINLTGAAPGAPKYEDTDGEDGITADDRTILGYGKENFRLNMSNTFSYNNFELYVLMSGVFGGNNYFLQPNSQAYLTSGTGLFNANMTYKPYWTPDNRSNVYPSATFSGDGRFLGLQSRSFVRVQDVSLSYNFNPQWLKESKINSFRLFLAAKNVATFSKWDGGDPETGATYLSGTFPVMTTYSLGLNISF